MRWAVLAMCVAAAFVAFAYPMYVIRPFRSQGADELAVALAIRSWGPAVAVLASVVAAAMAIVLWRASRRFAVKATCVLSATVTIAFAVLSHLNVYEKMFHRIDSPEAIAASEAALEGDDMVLAIRVGGEARAYPIRMMGYHHIVNDRLGGEPVVSTY